MVAPIRRIPPLPQRIELVVLDLIGTLIADDGHVERSFDDALRACGLALDTTQVSSVRGLSKRDAIRRLVAHSADAAPPEVGMLAATVHASFCERLTSAYDERPPRLQPGAGEVLHWLACGERRAAITTGLDRVVAHSLLQAVATLARVPDCLVTGEDVPEGRPAPFLLFRAMEAVRVTSVHAVAAVGDTTADLRAGWNAGVRLNVGVLGGAHGRAQLEREPHTHIIGTLQELPAIVEAVEKGAR